MKKHEVVLDFTSLLDVILIILFLVLCTMNGKAQKDADKIDSLTQAQITMEAQLTEQTGQIEELTNKNREQAALLEEMEAIKKENERLQAQAEKAEAERKDALELLNKALDFNNLGKYDLQLFDFAKKYVTILELRLTWGEDPTKCFVDLYRDGLLKIRMVMDPHSTKIEKNQEDVERWLSNYLKQAYPADKDATIYLSVQYDSNNIANSAPEPVAKAILAIAKKQEEGYHLVVNPELYDFN